MKNIEGQMADFWEKISTIKYKTKLKIQKLRIEEQIVLRIWRQL